MCLRTSFCHSFGVHIIVQHHSKGSANAPPLPIVCQAFGLPWAYVTSLQTRLLAFHSRTLRRCKPGFRPFAPIHECRVFTSLTSLLRHVSAARRCRLDSLPDCYIPPH